MRKMSRLAAFVIAAVAVASIAAALSIGTRPKEEETLLTRYEGAFRSLFPQAGDAPDGFEQLAAAEGVDAAYAVLRGGETLGCAVVKTVQGYAGPIEVTVGIHPDRTLSGILVGGNDFRETEGLGAKAKDAAFTAQFAGKHVPLELGQDIDAIAGATITSRAVVDAVNAAAKSIESMLSPGPMQGSTVNASAIGYAGPVLVRMTLKEDGTIAAVDIGGARFAETEGVGSRVREEEFTSQFIGKKPPLIPGKDVDIIAGATLSSEAAIQAINDGAAFLTQK